MPDGYADRVAIGGVARASPATRVGTLREFCMLVEIREENPCDITAIRDVNKRAFGQDQEGNIVDALRSNGAAWLSLVATLNGRVVASGECELVMTEPITNGSRWRTTIFCQRLD